MKYTIEQQKELEIKELEYWLDGKGKTKYPPQSDIIVENLSNYNIEDLCNSLKGLNEFNVNIVVKGNTEYILLENRKTNNLSKISFLTFMNDVMMTYDNAEDGKICVDKVCNWLLENK